MKLNNKFNILRLKVDHGHCHHCHR